MNTVLIMDKSKVGEMVDRGDVLPFQWRWVGTKTACDMLNCSAKHLQRLRERGFLRYSNPTGGKILYDVKSLNEFVENSAVEPFKKF